jgi:hypothetical protein
MLAPNTQPEKPTERIEKIALIGAHPASNLLAPFNDPSWTIWACSPTNAGKLARVDTWFELHGDLRWPEFADWAFDYTLWLQNQSFPVYAIDQSAIPRALTFPKDEMIKLYGVRHFTSSFSWMMAYAIAKRPKVIAIFGIDMNTPGEYANQRADFQHFMDVAEMTGIQLLAPDESDILQPPSLYGYDRTTALKRKLIVRKAEYQNRLQIRQRKVDEYVQEISRIRGAIEEIEYMETTWTGHSRDLDNQVQADWHPTPRIIDTRASEPAKEETPATPLPVTPRPRARAPSPSAVTPEKTHG